jgi:hypothetical protein
LVLNLAGSAIIIVATLKISPRGAIYEENQMEKTVKTFVDECGFKSPYGIYRAKFLIQLCLGNGLQDYRSMKPWLIKNWHQYKIE